MNRVLCGCVVCRTQEKVIPRFTLMLTESGVKSYKTQSNFIHCRFLPKRSDFVRYVCAFVSCVWCCSPLPFIAYPIGEFSSTFKHVLLILSQSYTLFTY